MIELIKMHLKNTPSVNQLASREVLSWRQERLSLSRHPILGARETVLSQRCAFWRRERYYCLPTLLVTMSAKILRVFFFTLWFWRQHTTLLSTPVYKSRESWSAKKLFFLVQTSISVICFIFNSVFTVWPYFWASIVILFNLF